MGTLLWYSARHSSLWFEGSKRAEKVECMLYLYIVILDRDINAYQMRGTLFSTLIKIWMSSIGSVHKLVRNCSKMNPQCWPVFGQILWKEFKIWKEQRKGSNHLIAIHGSSYLSNSYHLSNIYWLELDLLGIRGLEAVKPDFSSDMHIYQLVRMYVSKCVRLMPKVKWVKERRAVSQFVLKSCNLT